MPKCTIKPPEFALLQLLKMSLKDILESGPDIIRGLMCYVSGISELQSCFEEVIQQIRHTLTVLDELEGDVVDLKLNVLECRTLLSKAYNCACLFMDRVEKCLEYGDLKQQRRNEIKENARNGDFTKAISYLNQLRRFFEQCGTCYTAFEGFNNSAISLSGKSVVICNDKKGECSGGQTTTTAGKVLMGLGVAAGVGGLAAVAGIFTFGIGTPLVLGAAATATGVGGTGAVIAGNAVRSRGEHYTRLEQEFRKIGAKFEKMRDVAGTMDEKMDKVKSSLSAMEYDHTNVSKNTTKEDIDTFNSVFETLLTDIAQERKKLKAIKYVVVKSKEELNNIEK